MGIQTDRIHAAIHDLPEKVRVIINTQLHFVWNHVMSTRGITGCIPQKLRATRTKSGKATGLHLQQL
jgi:hypothetical protein